MKMDWEVFIAVITWSIVIASAICTLFMGISWMETELWEDARFYLKVMCVSLPVLTIGAAIIGGMGWINL